MAVSYHRFFDDMQAVVESIVHDSDSATRLSNLQRLTIDFRKILLDARDSAAYELRSKYSSEDAAAISKIDRQYIDYWAHRHRKRHSLPELRRKKRIDLAKVIDLSGRQASPPNLPPKPPERQD